MRKNITTVYYSIYLKLKTCKTIILLMETKTFMILFFSKKWD